MFYAYLKTLVILILFNSISRKDAKAKRGHDGSKI